ncbi:TonB-dependent receptor [Seonamhaeicola marinus]|uniref:TonB-dependent receptor plug domain-containing protein n=1 Tax=Seonamhaeicola marinus TaxID=1912246 RepID=A0A5D0JBI0_9FLAO|nr:TonB-dependent receptor [Seonamhaeicola marinus]TYA92238.1 TonB-dependent receptor plug domain-containing protein [Seonamhaeicola marinus]
MAGKISKIGLALGFLFFLSINLKAQEENKQKTLSEIIIVLETRFNVTFNYAEDIVKNIRLFAPDAEMSLKNTLVYLEGNTALTFSTLNETIVLIKPKPKDYPFICGYLKDQNGSPISRALVQSSKFRVTSNDNGFFSIKTTGGESKIKIEHLGFKTLEKTFSELNSEGLCPELRLQQELQPLSEVVISNYLATGINKISNGSFEIDFSKFNILPGLINNDVLQSVQAFPGIISANETVSNINIRGGTHDQNLILWDGIKMYQSGHFFGLISMYNPNITQKVVLRKNGSDVSYTDGVSGSILMKTEEKINDSFKGSVALNLTNVNAFVDTPLGRKSSLQIAGRKSISEVLETPTYKSFFKRISQNTEVANNVMAISNTDEAFNFYDTSLRWIYRINDNEELRLNFIAAHNKLRFNENAVIYDETESRASELTQNSIAGALFYKRQWSSKFQTIFEIYETDYKLKALNANILESQRFLQENVVSETSSKLNANYRFSNTSNILFGYHFVETEITNLDDVDNPIYRLLVSEVLRTHGVFSQFNYKSKVGTTNFNLGLRYNYISKFKKALLEPRFSFMQRFANHFTFELLGEFKHQNTSQIINFQSDFLGIENRRWQLSNNNDIPIIRSKQVSAGINFNQSNWLVSVKGYLKDVDGITSQSQGFQNDYQFVRSKGSYESYGLDVLIRKQIDNFNVWLSYFNLNSTYKFSELETGSFPSNYSIAHAITFGANYTDAKLKLSAGLNWHSGKPVTFPVEGNEVTANSINFEDTNASSLKDYLRLDVSALYNFKLGNKTTAIAGLSVWNVLNQSNELNTFYSLDNDVLNETVQQSLGFTPNAVFKVQF